MLMLMVTHRFVDPLFFNPSLALQSVLLYHHIHTLEPTPINHNNGVTYCNAARARNLGADSSQQSQPRTMSVVVQQGPVITAHQLFSIRAQSARHTTTLLRDHHYNTSSSISFHKVHHYAVYPPTFIYALNLHLLLMVLLHSSTCMAGQN